MAVDAQLTEEDEERLAALWDQPLDAADVDDQSAEDGIAALFSSPHRAAARAAPRAHASTARRSAPRRRFPRSQGSCRRRLPRSRATSRSVAIGAVLVAASVSLSIALSALTGPTDTPPATYPRATADRAPAASPPTLPSRGQRDLRRVRSTRAPAHRRDEDRRPIARADTTRSQTARHDRAARPAPAQQRRRSARRFVATPVAPLTPQPHRVPATPAPVSSACEEFPPC